MRVRMLGRVLMVMLAGWSARTGIAAETFAAARAQIERALSEQNIPSITVAVARHGTIVWEEGFGWADREHKVRATPHTMYSLASISKPFTATGLMTLVQSGQISLDRPINDYLGAAKLIARVGDERDATVRRVANHTSGLPEHCQFFFSDEPQRRPPMDETLLRYGNLMMAPGERYQYSNLGYGVLDHVIARVSGQSYADFMQRQVFVPLGLTHTSVGIGNGQQGFQAIRYDAAGAPIPFYDFDHSGASAVYSSAHDLVRFAMFHLRDSVAGQKQILTADSLDEMQRTTTARGAAPESGYGVGWMTQDRADGYRFFGHTGSMPGVATSLSIVPAEDVAVVLLSNSRTSLPPLRDVVMKALLPNWAVTPIEPPPVTHSDEAPGFSGVWAGTLLTYTGDMRLRLEARPDRSVRVYLGTQPAVTLQDVRFENDLLEGTFTGDITTPDVSRHRSHLLSVLLKVRGNVLNGAVTALDLGPRTSALGHWAELKRLPEGAEATVVRTEYGVVHVRAKDWKGLGYGHGYAAAQDNLCVLADALVTLRGERSRYFGPGARVPRVGTLHNFDNLDEDFFFRHVLSDPAVERFRSAQSATLQELVEGYAAGYNRYVREIRGGGDVGRHEACRGAEWLGEISADDIYRRMYGFELVTSSLRHVLPIATAQPLAASRQAATAGKMGLRQAATAGEMGLRQAATVGEMAPRSDEPGVGSNLFGFGSAMTGTRHALLFGNPHWFWDSVDRFYQVHLQMQGRIDVQGAAVLGVPIPIIGFNNDVAWSHTLSTAARYTVYRLQLADNDPTAYVYDGQVRHLKRVSITIEVRNDDGTIRPITRTVYDSHFGPMLADGWTSKEAFTLRDVNVENFRAYESWLRWGSAHSLDELMRVQREEVAVPWLNTIAVGRADGRVWYGDVGTVPNVPDSLRKACTVGRVPSGTDVALDGSRSTCEWRADPASPQPGALPAGQLPQFVRQDYAANMNDSYWLSNPHAPLTGYPEILGGEGVEQSLRTRLGHLLVEQRVAGVDGLPGHRVTTETLKRLVFNSRNLGAELFLDDVLGHLCPMDSIAARVHEACDVLRRWDRRGNPESVGALIWDRFWENLQRVPPAERYRVQFDASRPLETPRDLNASAPGVVQAFTTSVDEILGSQIQLGAPRAAYQFVTDSSGERIPLAGGCGLDGYFTVICTKWNPTGPEMTTHGNTYMQIVTFTDHHVEPYTILASSQSTDPASPHYRDYTRLYSHKQWLRAPFTDAEVKAAAVETVELREQ